MVLLKNVDSDIPLEKIIIQQHEFEGKEITEDEIKTILDSSKCLLVFDGYDEYKKGTNSAIDATISGEKRNSFVLITSRPDYMDKKDKNKLDGEIQINGLSDESVKECLDRYSDKDEMTQLETTSEDPELTKVNSQDFIKQAKKRGVFRLLNIPILLLMLIVLFVETKCLPERRKDIMWEIIQIYTKRAKEKGIEFEDSKVLLRHLGKLSYEASKRKTHTLLKKRLDQKF